MTAAAAVFLGHFDGGVCFAFAAAFGAGRTGFTAGIRLTVFFPPARAGFATASGANGAATGAASSISMPNTSANSAVPIAPSPAMAPAASPGACAAPLISSR